jgi:hypothetical protein
MSRRVASRRETSTTKRDGSLVGWEIDTILLVSVPYSSISVPGLVPGCHVLMHRSLRSDFTANPCADLSDN